MFDRTSMRAKLINSHKTVEKGLYRLWQHQTQDERVTIGTKHKNHRGFSHVTVTNGTILGEKIAKLVHLFLELGHTEETIPWGTLLPTPEERHEAFRICFHHARQLADLANETMAGRQAA